MTETELLRLLPPVLRARDFRLYTQGGRRFVDLWQNGGRAILGHTPPNLLRELKNTANRGLMSPLPHPQEQRFAKALSALFPNRAFRVYDGEASLRRALPAPGAVFADPAFPQTINSNGVNHRIMLWRPFLDTPASDAAGSPLFSSLLIPILPWPLSPRVLVMEAALALNFPPSDIIPPLILAAATRSIHDLIAALPARGAVSFPKINKVLYGGDKSAGKKWRRRGIYLTRVPSPNMESYAPLFRRFLEGGFLLPPGPQDPLILPAILSPGEEAKLAELLGSD